MEGTFAPASLVSVDHPLLMLLLIALAWPAIHLGVGYLAHRLPRGVFARGAREEAGRRERRFYERALRIRSWKDRLPEAGALFRGGFAKRSLDSDSPDYLERFVEETRRAELSHWLTLLASFSFFAWLPAIVAVWMPLYALAANLPCILVQRYNRPRLRHLAARAELRVRSARS